MPPRESRLEAEAALLVMAANLPQPERNYPLGCEIGRKWTIDFAWPEHRIGLEIDGGAIIHRRVNGRVIAIPGRHHSEAGRRRDMIRDAYAMLTGWRIFRADAAILRAGLALDWVRLALHSIGHCEFARADAAVFFRSIGR